MSHGIAHGRDGVVAWKSNLEIILRGNPRCLGSRLFLQSAEVLENNAVFRYRVIQQLDGATIIGEIFTTYFLNLLLAIVNLMPEKFSKSVLRVWYSLVHQQE